MLNKIAFSVAGEFKVMVKEKMIFIVLIVIPVLVNFLLGYEFSGEQIQNIPMAVIDQDHSSLSRMIVQQFNEDEIFDIKYRLDNSQQMKELFDKSHIRAGMIIPKGFGSDVTQLQSPTLLMLYDGSHMSIAGAAKSKASEILLTLKTGILIKLLEGKMNFPEDTAKKMALSIQFSNRTLYNPAKSFKNFLNTGFGVAIVQSAIALLTAVCVRKSELERGIAARIAYLIGKVAFYTVLGSLSLIASIFIQSKLFGIPFRGRIEDALLLSVLFAAAVTTFGVMLSTWIKNQMIATIISAVLFVPNTVMIGYTWPILSMPRPYQTAAYYYPFYHYADNLRDLFLKGISIDFIIKDIYWLMYFTLISFLFSILGVIPFKMKTSKEALLKEGESIETCKAVVR